MTTLFYIVTTIAVCISAAVIIGVISCGVLYIIARYYQHKERRRLNRVLDWKLRR